MNKIATPATAPSFDDLAELNDIDLAAVLREADRNLLVLAISGAEKMFAERVLSLLPRLEADDVREQLNDLGPIRISDVETAQYQLAQMAGRFKNDRSQAAALRMAA